MGSAGDSVNRARLREWCWGRESQETGRKDLVLILKDDTERMGNLYLLNTPREGGELEVRSHH